jgi:CrcB protein
MWISQLPPLDQLAVVFIGGAIGSVARFVAGYLLGSMLGTAFPWATLLVNTFGSMWLGYVGTVTILKPAAIDPNLRLALTTGFAGGFTTFSTFTFETLMLYQRGEIDLVPLNIVCNFILAFWGVWVGIVVARLS